MASLAFTDRTTLVQDVRDSRQFSNAEVSFLGQIRSV